MTNRKIAYIVKDQKPLVLTAHETVQHACRCMRERRAGSVLVIDDQQHLCGIFTGGAGEHRDARADGWRRRVQARFDARRVRVDLPHDFERMRIDDRGDDGFAAQVHAPGARGNLNLSVPADLSETSAVDDKRRIVDGRAPIADDDDARVLAKANSHTATVVKRHPGRSARGVQ